MPWIFFPGERREERLVGWTQMDSFPSPKALTCRMYRISMRTIYMSCVQVVHTRYIHACVCRGVVRAFLHIYVLFTFVHNMSRPSAAPGVSLAALRVQYVLLEVSQHEKKKYPLYAAVLRE